MSKLYSSHKRLIGIGLMGTLVIALAVLGTLWGFSQKASAQSTPVTLAHVEPSGIDYTGNPYCPDTDWSDGKNKPIANAWHDCNNITSQNHVIRTNGADPTLTGGSWNIENFSGANATSLATGECGTIAEVTSRPGWADECANNVDDDSDTYFNDGCAAEGAAETVCDEATCDDADGVPPWDNCDDDADGYINDGCVADGTAELDLAHERCLVIHSSTPGETRVTWTYNDGGTVYTTGAVVKEWDSLVDSVILKYGDLEKVKVYYDGDGDTVADENKELYLPKDVNNDGVRDTDDEHDLDKQSTWQDHGVVWDEALKRIKVPVPLEITEIVHGEHEVLINSVSVVTHQPTEGALILAELDSERNCTFFTNDNGTANLGDTIETTSDNLGRVVVYLDTVCEEQVIVNFYAQYPNLPGSLRLGLHEWIGINWTTVELAKQPQIRWAGEQIVLAKRWALPDEWWPNDNCGPDSDQDCPVCPLATVKGAVFSDEDGDTVLYDQVVSHHVNYVLKAPVVGGLEGGYLDMTGDGVLDTLSFMGATEAVGHIDNDCISKALADSEDPGEQDIEAKLLEDTYICDPLEPVGQAATQQQLPMEIDWNSTIGSWGCYDPMGIYTGPARLVSSVPINKHAWLVYYLKIYQVKLTNVDGVRDYHNDGDWSFGDGDDTTEDTLNVSQDALLRVKVKGWFFNADNSSRGAVCIDMDGDGDGNDETTDDEPGAPYPLPMYETGCPDPDDQILDHGHWVLPDDLATLAGPDAINTRPNWDVMSEPEDSSTTAIGPKNTLDSHDGVLRAWLGRITVVPDGEITEADAIMPPLKIRASIDIDNDDAGFLKEALKDVIYGSTNDYHSIMIPADSEIPAIVNNGGYDWMSYGLPPCPDIDDDHVCNDVDLCPDDFDPTNNDEDNDDVGDVCDEDDDGDTILDSGDGDDIIGNNPCPDGVTANCDDNCPLNANDTQADGADADDVGTACDIDDEVAGTRATDLDSDGDDVPDATDNCPADSNEDQKDIDGDLVGDKCDPHPSVPLGQAPPVPYPFWTIINKFGADDSDIPTPYYIEIYTDNRGEGMLFANGDHNLSYDDCRSDPVTNAPDCSPGDVVGESNITVIGDYPYFRKHSAVLSNPVVKTWEWGGFKSVTAEHIDANHTAIIAHLVDRDGYCKYEVDYPDVITSPSLNPVQGEEIEFILNTEVGSIIDVSPNGVYEPPAPHDPLTEATVVDADDGFINASRDDAVALAEDARVLDGLEEAELVDVGGREVIDEAECQAWVLIEHPLGAELDVSVRFDDPEGVIIRHWPPTELLVNLVQGWNDVCYVDDEADVEDALAAVIEDVLAVYRFNADQTWDRHFPGRCEEDETLCNLDPIMPYDQLFILMGGSGIWVQDNISVGAPASNKDERVDLAGASADDGVPAAWNSVCYAGVDQTAEAATSDISSAFEIMYTLGADQAWRRYIPDRPDIPDTLTTLHQFDSVILLVTAEGGVTWVFDS